MRASPVRVMIVEDSTVVRHLLTHIVSGDERLAVAAAVASAEEAIAALPDIRPDVISMDVRLPGIDGLEATRRIMAEQPTPIVVIASTAGRDLDLSMEALSSGALAVVEKPVGTSNADYQNMADRIRTQLRIMSDVAVVRRRMRTPATKPGPRPRVGAAPSLIACAASTGGPQALSALLAALPAELPVPVLLVQHMGAAFMSGFVRWLDGVVPQRVCEAKDGEPAKAGIVHVAPGDRHLRIDREGRLRIGEDLPIRSQRPAATALFQSVAEMRGAGGLGIVLTGMGEDGAPGVRSMIGAGATVLAEDETSAIVYGMPAAAVREGATGMPLAQIAPQVMTLLAEAGTQ